MEARADVRARLGFRILLKIFAKQKENHGASVLASDLKINKRLAYNNQKLGIFNSNFWAHLKIVF